LSIVKHGELQPQNDQLPGWVAMETDAHALSAFDNASRNNHLERREREEEETRMKR